jgi:hypothetical protein
MSALGHSVVIHVNNLSFSLFLRRPFVDKPYSVRFSLSRQNICSPTSISLSDLFVSHVRKSPTCFLCVCVCVCVCTLLSRLRLVRRVSWRDLFILKQTSAFFFAHWLSTGSAVRTFAFAPSSQPCSPPVVWFIHTHTHTHTHTRLMYVKLRNCDGI